LSMDDIEILKNIFIFSNFNLEELAQIQAIAIVEKYKKGEVIFAEDDPPLWLKVLKKGKAKIYKQSKTGKETILRIVGAGDILGGLSVFDGRNYSFTAKAMEPCSLLKIPRMEFLALLRRNPDVAFEIILDLTQRLRETGETIQGLAVERVEKRIVTLFLKLADRLGENEGGRVRIPVSMTRQDIADMVGSTVETAIRIVSRLSKEGLIETKGKTIIIKDIERLKSLPEEIF